jgi:sialate O-acetylesterase
MTSGAAPGVASMARPGSVTAVPALMGDHMVLPLVDGQATLRGQARPNELVTATLGGRVAHARADADGRWTLTWPANGVDPGLAKGKPPRPFTLRLGGPAGRVAKDVVLGEIWLAAGQSNMAMPVAQAQGAAALAEDAVAASLRFFRIDNDTEGDLSAIHGQWVRATVGEAARFSAVAASFGVALRRQRSHAIGLVQAAWNATPLASWIRDDAWAAAGHAELRPPWPPPPSAEEVKAYETKRAAWTKAARYRDGDDEGSAQGWSGAAFDDRGWAIEAVPGAWDNEGRPGFDGVVWYRTRASLPSPCLGRALDLSLGPIDDCDRTFVNGKLVGATCHEIENPYRIARHYRVPASLATRELSLAVRVVDEIGDGGFTGLAEEMKVGCTTSRGALTVPLAGPWRVAVEKEAPRERPGPEAAPTPPAGWPSPLMPGALARGWLRHLAAFPFEGVLWYQGENNLGQAQTYAASLEVWLADWCRLFARADLPVLLVQLPGHARPNHALGTTERPWAEIREAQRALAHHAKANVRLAITTDLGQGASIHPTLKRPIGERLAWLALHPEAPATGPWFVAATRGSDAAALSFVTTGKLRVTARANHREGSAPPDEKSALPVTGDVNVVGFRVVDGSGKETRALARVEGDKVVVTWEPGIDVRALVYGWDDDPLGPLPDGELPAGTLTDDTGWPASPFRATIERAAARP